MSLEAQEYEASGNHVRAFLLAEQSIVINSLGPIDYSITWYSNYSASMSLLLASGFAGFSSCKVSAYTWQTRRNFIASGDDLSLELDGIGDEEFDSEYAFLCPEFEDFALAWHAMPVGNPVNFPPKVARCMIGFSSQEIDRTFIQRIFQATRARSVDDDVMNKVVNEELDRTSHEYRAAEWSWYLPKLGG